MTRPLMETLTDGIASSDAVTLARWEKLEADISHFVEGGYINWGLMKWLEPKKQGFWELKSIRPRPSLRVFGRFAHEDVFVGTHVVERAGLKGKWSLEWELEKLACEESWRLALGDLEPFSAQFYESYITTNAEKNVRIPS